MVWILAGGFWLGSWWLVNRQSRGRAFSYRFPTLLLEFGGLVWLLEAEGVEMRGRVYDAAFTAATGFNSPVLAAILLVNAAFADFLPRWSVAPLDWILFWMSWHLILRYLRRRAFLNEPISLRISNSPSSRP